MKLGQLRRHLLMFLLLCAGAQLASAQCHYDVTVIQAPDCPPYGTADVFVADLSENGAVAGSFALCLGLPTPFIWTDADGFQALGLPPGVESAGAKGVNEKFEAVVSNAIQTFLWREGEYFELEAAPGEEPRIQGTAISSAGLIVGRRTLPDGDANRQAFVWSEQKGFTDLGFMGSDHTVADAVNDAGDVAGDVGDVVHGEAFLSQGGTTQLLGSIPEGTSSNVRGMNNLGHLACFGQPTAEHPSGLEFRPAIWRNDQWELLPVPKWATRGFAADLNDAGQVVGDAQSDTQLSALLWQNGLWYDLIDLVPPNADVVFYAACAISNAGQILVEGDSAYLLTPSSFPVGDVDQDCQVGATDLFSVLSDWGSSSATADIDADGIVGFSDLLVVLSNWG